MRFVIRRPRHGSIPRQPRRSRFTALFYRTGQRFGAAPVPS